MSDIKMTGVVPPVQTLATRAGATSCYFLSAIYIGCCKRAIDAGKETMPAEEVTSRMCASIKDFDENVREDIISDEYLVKKPWVVATKYGIDKYTSVDKLYGNDAKKWVAAHPNEVYVGYWERGSLGHFVVMRNNEVLWNSLKTSSCVTMGKCTSIRVFR